MSSRNESFLADINDDFDIIEEKTIVYNESPLSMNGKNQF